MVHGIASKNIITRLEPFARCYKSNVRRLTLLSPQTESFLSGLNKLYRSEDITDTSKKILTESKHKLQTTTSLLQSRGNTSQLLKDLQGITPSLRELYTDPMFDLQPRELSHTADLFWAFKKDGFIVGDVFDYDPEYQEMYLALSERDVFKNIEFLEERGAGNGSFLISLFLKLQNADYQVKGGIVSDINLNLIRISDQFVQYYGLKDFVLPGLANSFVETGNFNNYSKLIIANKVATVMDYLRGRDMAISCANSLHQKGDFFVMTTYSLKGSEYEKVRRSTSDWKLSEDNELCETYIHDVDKQTVINQASQYGVSISLEDFSNAAQYVSFHSDKGIKKLVHEVESNSFARCTDVVSLSELDKKLLIFKKEII